MSGSAVDDPFAAPERREAHSAARRVSTSDALGWEHVHASGWEDVAQAEAFEMPSSASHRIVLVTQGRYVIESRRGTRWQQALYGPGSLGLTVAGAKDTLRWRSATSEPLRSVHLYLDAAMVSEAFCELTGRDVGTFPDALQLDAPQVQASVRDLAWALEIAAPPLYADAAAHVLAAKLAVTSAPEQGYRRTSGLDSKVLARLVEYLHTNLSEAITLDDLSAVANLSKHHLLRQFKASTGLPPHRFLHQLRMQHAEHVLAQGHRTVESVAHLCGYASDRQFSAAFKRHSGMSPARWSAARSPGRPSTGS